MNRWTVPHFPPISPVVQIKSQPLRGLLAKSCRFMFMGATPILSLGFAPIVAWVLYLDFDDSNSPWLLVGAAGLAALADFLDEKRSVLNTAVVLSTFAWCIAFTGVLRSAWLQKLTFFQWVGVELITTVWFGVGILITTLVFVAFGRGIRLIIGLRLGSH